jgi:hypothetical protein
MSTVFTGGYLKDIAQENTAGVGGNRGDRLAIVFNGDLGIGEEAGTTDNYRCTDVATFLADIQLGR